MAVQDTRVIVEGILRRKHRQWSVSEKRRIVAEANQPGTTKAAVARRHGISDSQLYAWCKALEGQPHESFLSVITDDPSPSHDDGSSSSIDIVLANGHRLTVSGPVDPAHIERLLRALAST